MVEKPKPKKADMMEISHPHGPTPGHPYKHVDIYWRDNLGKIEKKSHGHKIESWDRWNVSASGILTIKGISKKKVERWPMTIWGKWSSLNYNIELNEEMDRHLKRKSELKNKYEKGEISTKTYKTQLKNEEYFNEVARKAIFIKWIK